MRTNVGIGGNLGRGFNDSRRVNTHAALLALSCHLHQASQTFAGVGNAQKRSLHGLLGLEVGIYKYDTPFELI